MLPPDVHPSKPDLVFVAAFGKEGGAAGLRLVHELRLRGIPADTDYRAATLKSLLRQADRRQAAFTLLVGDDEAARGSVVIRNMRTKDQKEVPLASAADALAGLLRAPAT